MSRIMPGRYRGGLGASTPVLEKSMSKPWHHMLRYIAPGSWQAGGPRVTLVDVNRQEVLMRFGCKTAPTVAFTPQGLRLLGDFCRELADQVENG